MLHVRFLSQSFDYMCTGPSPAFHICSGVPAWVMVFYSKDFIDQAVSPALSQYLSCRLLLHGFSVVVHHCVSVTFLLSVWCSADSTCVYLRAHESVSETQTRA